MSKRKICVVTGTRAEYGLLYWLMKEIEADAELELQLIVTGMHLSPEFGLTYKEIEKEFSIDEKIDIDLSDDTPLGIANSMALMQVGTTKALSKLQPDLLVLLGDRYEIFSAASAALISTIPIVHIHGGETTEGAYDEAFRHSITKMSHLHFTATDAYKNRVIQLGEEPQRVFNVGGMGIESIKRLQLLSKEAFEESIDFKLNKKNILITFHPVTLEVATAKEQFSSLLEAIDELKETNIIFTKANSDTDGKVINQMIDEYVTHNPHKSIAFTSLGQLRYLSALQFIDAVVGNSSSGLLEAPSFKIGTINIGDRQKGRVKAQSVIDAQATKLSITQAFDKLYTTEFQELLGNVTNPYESQTYPSKTIVQVLKQHNIKSIMKKKFYNMEKNHGK